MGNFTIYIIHQRVFKKWHKEDEMGGVFIKKKPLEK